MRRPGQAQPTHASAQAVPAPVVAKPASVATEPALAVQEPPENVLEPPQAPAVEEQPLPVQALPPDVEEPAWFVDEPAEFVEEPAWFVDEPTEFADEPAEFAPEPMRVVQAPPPVIEEQTLTFKAPPLEVEQPPQFIEEAPQFIEEAPQFIEEAPQFIDPPLIEEPEHLVENQPQFIDEPPLDLDEPPLGVEETPRLIEDEQPQETQRPEHWRRFYLPLKARAALTMLAGTAWLLFSLWLSRHWITSLGKDITVPLAAVLITGIALIPGYLNIQLLSSVVLDRPPRLRMDCDFPHIALLIAAYNEEASIAETLDYALRSDYPSTFEIVVADDGSTDRTCEIVTDYAAHDPRVRLMEVPHGGKALALNAALAEIGAPLVATIDADTLLMPYSLKHAVARLMASPPDTVAVAGAVLVRNSRENLLTRAQEWDYFLGIASVKRAQALLQGTLVAQGAFSVYDTAALRLVGGWPNRIGEDIVLTWRMILRGGRSVFEPTAVAFTEAPASWGAFARQRRRWARGMIEGLRDHGVSLIRRLNLYSHSVASNFLFPLLDGCFTLAFIPGIALAAAGNFAIVGPMTLLVLPLNAMLGGVMFFHQRRVFKSVNLRVRNNRRGLLFYFFCYQFVMSPISLAGYTLEMVRARRAW